MRYAPSLPPATTATEPRQVASLIGIRAVKPVQTRAQPEVESATAREETMRHIEEQQRRNLPPQDRRTYCRRVQNLPVLVELRSGVERRRHNLFESGSDEHVDVEA